MNKAKSSVAILGAGITGLSVAYALQKQGHAVTVYEKSDGAGGVIRSERMDEWLVEQGPNTVLVKDAGIWELLEELGLDESITEPGPEARKRFVVRDGEPKPVPMSIGGFLTTDLFSFSAKLRLLKEPFVSAPAAGNEDESIARFISRRLGIEPLDYGVNPFVSGVYAGDPKELSVKHTFTSLFKMEQQHGSLAKGVFKRRKSGPSVRRSLLSFGQGLQQLPAALADALGDDLQTGTMVQSIQPADKGWSITIEQDDSSSTVHHTAVISTLPAYQLHAVLNTASSQAPIADLNKIEYAPMSVLALGFRREQVGHPLDGFGMLVPEKEPYNLLGCLFSSSLFPNRAPEGHVLLTCFIGGARYPIMARRSTEALIEQTLPELQELLNISGDPIFDRHTFWEKAIPQYTVGYDRFLDSMDRLESSHTGLFLAGNYRHGVSVPDCITNGMKAAERVHQYLSDL